MRKIFSHAFSHKAVQEQEPLIRTNVDKLAKKPEEATVEDFERKFDICLWYT
jgi:cytochrome P450